jgi:hypothetical protein
MDTGKKFGFYFYKICEKVLSFVEMHLKFAKSANMTKKYAYYNNVQTLIIYSYS